ncbi:MAG: phosphoenolpyruvate--protein phosphotransferase [Balneolaceae bacterium]
MSDPASADNRLVLKGISASSGMTLGKVWISRVKHISVREHKIDSSRVESQMDKFREGIEKVEKQLRALKQQQENQEIKDIIETQIHILHDPELNKRIQYLVKEELNGAGYAVYRAFNEYIDLLEHAENMWGRERSIDIISIRDDVIRQISGKEEKNEIPENAILLADDLSPTEVIELHQQNVGAILLFRGGTTAHAVIIAQSLGIPCIVGVHWENADVKNNMFALVDAESGEVIFNPDEQTKQEFITRKQEFEARKQEADALTRQANRTACGSDFHIRANVEFTEELARVRQFNAEGIGLLRTETLFLQKGYYEPDQHFTFYSTILEQTGDQPVVIRLLDIGGDKLPGNKIHESNPFLGWRGIRVLLDEKELLHQQLRTLFEVSEQFPGRVRILVPMVSDLREFDEFRQEMDLVRENMCQEGKTIRNDIPVGIMVEVPALALQSRHAAEEADFFSIGSNDLTQYTLAADRGNERVSDLYQNSHPAVWHLIKVTYEAAQSSGIPIHVCGEIAGKPLLAAALIGLGIRELSMNPASIPQVKKVLCNHSVSEFEELFSGINAARDGNEAETVLNQWKVKYLNH